MKTYRMVDLQEQGWVTSVLHDPRQNCRLNDRHSGTYALPPWGEAQRPHLTQEENMKRTMHSKCSATPAHLLA
uniref:Uncharacterized protein n=1 Tax=Anguilla anguilla TaxID=7936 RepID=A0A0E9RNC8_ANGAN